MKIIALDVKIYFFSCLGVILLTFNCLIYILLIIIILDMKIIDL